MSDLESSPSRPEWLDDEFVKHCIKNDIGAKTTSEIDLHDIKIQYVVPKGENYASIILRVVAYGDFAPTKQNGHLSNGDSKKSNGNVPPNEKRYILKVPHAEGALKDLMDDYSAFDREVDMYRNIVPKYAKILKEVDLDTTFACRCVHSLKKNEVFAMEDLGVQKYILANRMHGTDLQHTRLLVRKLARLHGVSMRIYEQNQLKDLPAYYFQGLIREVADKKLQAALDPLFGKTMFTQKVTIMANDLKKRPGYEKEAKLVADMADMAYKLLCEHFTYKPGHPLNAHLHGDCWINNMLFKYGDDGKPVDVMLLDLQCSYVNSIANEFMYFFLSSVSDDVREHHYYDVVDYYYENLIETLKRVGYEGTEPTLELLLKELTKSSTIFLMIVSFMLPVLKKQFGQEANDRSKSDSITLEEASAIADANRDSPVYLKTLFITIDLMKKIGAFEYYAELVKTINK